MNGAALVCLTVAGAALAVLGVFAVPLTLWPVPFSLALPVLLLCNVAVTALAGSVSSRPWQALLPMGAWTAVVLLAWVGGPGGDAVIPADNPRGLVLLALAAIPAGVVFVRSTLRALDAGGAAR